MGLLSFLKKNKQETAPGEREFHSRAEEESTAVRARGRRSSGAAGREAMDPVLPEKKRARRRLIGAVALVLAVIVVLPMVLDSEPKPLAGDVAIHIPSRDKPFASASSKVAASAGLDEGEEVVAANTDDAPDAEKENAPAVAKNNAPQPSSTAAPSASPSASPTVAPSPKPATSPPTMPTMPAIAPVTAAVKNPAKSADEEERTSKPSREENKPAPKNEARADSKADKTEVKKADKSEERSETKADAKVDAKHETKAEAKPEPRSEVRSEPRDSEAERAKAILEGRPAETETSKPKSSKIVLQVAALASQEKVDELQARLREAGLKSFVQKVGDGSKIRVRVGPYADKAEAERARAKLEAMGLSAAQVSQ